MAKVKKPKKKPVKKRVPKKIPTRRKLTPDLDPDVRRCIVEEIASAKGRKLTKGQKRALFDRAYAKCIRRSR